MAEFEAEPQPCLLSGRAGALLAWRGEHRRGPVLSLLILLALAGLAAALLAVAAWPGMAPRRQALAVAGLCLAGAGLDLAFLVSGAGAASMHLPLGLAGYGATLSLDPLGGVFLLPMLAGAGACCLGAAGPAERRRRGVAAAGLPCCLAALLLTCLAGDGFTLLLAASSVPAAAALCARDAARLPGEPRGGRQLFLPDAAPGRNGTAGHETARHGAARLGAARHETARLGADLDGPDGARGGANGGWVQGLAVVPDPVAGPVLATLCLAGAIALLVPGAGLLAGPAFAAIRAHPPEGWRATAVLACSLLGTARLCAPWRHPGRTRAAPEAFAGPGAGRLAQGIPGVAPGVGPDAPEVRPGTEAALATAVPLAGLYVLTRLLLDLCGPATPLWWGVPVLAAGSVAVAAGGLRAATAARLEGIAEGIVAGAGGLAAAGLGVALLARGADLPLLAALSLGGTLLLVLAQGPLVALLLLANAAIGLAAGTTALARLGGLLGRMPVAGACLLAAAASVARLPVSAGFAGGWMLAEALLQAPRLGGPWLGVVAAAAVAVLACGTALFAAAALRLVGTALLGRPRSPRGAAADDVAAPLRQVLVALAAALGVIGVAPPLALALAGPAVAQLSLAVPEGAASAAWTTSPLRDAGMTSPLRDAGMMSPLRDGAGYAALPLAGLVAVAAGSLAWVARRRMARGVVERPGWEGGFAAPPPWLPFGDPATQLGPRAIDAPLLRLAAGPGRSQERVPDRVVERASGPGWDETGAGETGGSEAGAAAGGAAAGGAAAGGAAAGGAAAGGAALLRAGLRGAGECEAWVGRASLPWLVGVAAALLCLLVWAGT